jgi:hypothetical protein
LKPLKGPDFILWMIVLLAWAILEGRGLLSKNDWTFTAILLRYIPPDILAALWGWLGWHFLIKPHV